MAAQVIDKATGKTQEVSQDVIDLDRPSIVELDIDRADVSSIERQGDDLVIRLKSGDVIRIVDYYDSGAQGEQSDVVFHERDGRLWGVRHDGSFHLYEIKDLNEFVGVAAAGASEGGGLGIIAPALSLLGGAGLVAAAAGGGGGGSSGGDGVAPSAPGLSLSNDTGASATDEVTNSGRLMVSGLETGATYEYSTDGRTWTSGSGSSFELGEGTYASVRVRQTDAAGNVSPAVSLGAVTIDTTIAAPGVALASDTGASASDGVTSDGTVNVTGLEPGATYEYSLDGGASWTPGTGGSFELAAGTYTGVQVRSTDVAGNVSAPASLGPVTVVTGPAGDLTLALENDTGASAADGVTSDGTVVVGGVDAGASYEYSTDGGVTWTPGTGTSFELAEGTYTDVQVRQVDGAGNTGAPTSLGAVTVDASAPGALVPALVSDTGTSGSDGVTGNGTVSVAGLESGATYEYSTDGGASWTPGSGTSFALGAGTYADVQVRQVDVAGNTGPASSLGAVTVDVAAAAPLAALASDSGASASDNVTNDGTVTVGGLEAGATYEYSTDGGVTWTPGTGTSFELGEGTYAGVQVRQTDAAGNVSPAVSLGAVTIDTTIAAPGVALASDTGASASDGVTSDGTVNVTGLEPGATYEYSLDGGASWTPGTGGSFELAAGTYTGVQVRSTDVAGNVSAPASLGPVTVVTGPAGDLTLALENDTGASAADGVTSDGTVVVGGVDAGASYEYSTDGGVTWTPGTGTSFELAEGTYTDVQVRQVDGAGNTGAPTSLGAVTVDASAPGALVPALVSDTGTSGSDGVTGNGTVSVAGLESGATYEYSTDGGASWTPGSGTSFALGAGTYADVQVRQVDVAGNTGPASSLGAVTVDVAAAAPLAALASDSGASASDNVTNDGTVTVGGLEAGATYEYSTDGGVTWTPGTGTSFELGEGTYAGVQVRQTDAAGNVSPAVSLGAVTIDTTIAAPGVALASDTGASASDGVTSDGTVNVTGLEPGATYEYSLDGGASWTPGTGGSFELAAGTYTGVQVRSTDVAGNVSAPASLGPVTVVTGPAGDLTLALENDTGASAADGVTSDGTVVVGGVDAGASYEYSTDGGVTWTPGTGTSFELAEGTYTDVQVRQVDGAGNTGAPTSLGAVTVDASAPGALVPALVSDTGTSGSDGVTGNGTVSVAGLESGATYEYSTDGGASWTPGSGTSFALGAGTYADVQVRQVDVAGNTGPASSLGAVTVDVAAAAPLAALASDSGASASDNVTNDGTVTVGGLEAGATYEYSTDGGVTWTPGTGTSFELGEGTYAGVQVRQTDAAGNVSPAVSLGAVTIDTTIAAPGVALASDTGASASDGVTSDGTVNVTGLEPGATYEYSLDGGASWTPGTGGSFELAAGTYTGVQVRSTDVAGNVSAPASLGPVTVVTGPAGDLTLALENDTGASAADGVTSDGTVVVGGVDAGASYEYSTDGGVTWTPGTGTSFELAEGTYTDVQVRQVDGAGNTGAPTSLGAVTVDASAPGALVPALVSDTGTSGSDGVTGNGTVSVAGLESGATYEYSTDGGASWTPGSGTSFALGAGTYADVQVRQVDVAGNTGPASSLGAVTVDVAAAAPLAALASDSGASASDNVTNDGTVTVGGLEAGATYEYSTDGGVTWTPGTGTSFELGEGTYAGVQVRQTDAAGNVSPAVSLGAVTIDTTIAAPGVALASDTGASASDGVTSDGTVNVTGLEPGATYEYSLDGGASWTPGTGGSFELAAGTYTGVQVRSTDVAGNVSAPASLGPVTVVTGPAGDLTLALENDTGASAADGVTSDGTVVVGGVDAGASYEYSTDGGVTWTPGTGTSFELAEGTYTDVQVRQVDGAGNTGAPTSLGAVTVDASAPGALVPALVSDTGTSGSDGVTGNGTVSVAGLESGATYEYSTDGGASWTPGSGTSFALGAGTYADVQVRQVDVAGNTGPASSLGAVTVDVAAAAPLAALASDSGASASDNVTNDGTVTVGGLEAGATYEYSTDGGVTWTPGTGTSFELGEGTYAGVQVRQTDAAGNVSPAVSLGAVTIDTTIAAPGVALASDTGASASDGVTSDGTVNVTGLEPGATYEYSLDGGASWTPGTGGSFELAAGTYTGVQVRSTDVAGNVSAPASLGPVTVVTGPAGDLTLALENDTGASAADGVTSDGTVVVGGVDAGASYEYSTDGGVTWTPGTGTSFELAEGTYTDVQVRQVDGAGNTGAPTSLGAVTVDASAPGALVPALVSDTGTSGSDGVTGNGTVSVAGLESGATYEYSTDGGASWTPGSGTSFALGAGTYADVQVRQVDVAGNTGPASSLGAVTVDVAAAAPLAALASDSGASASDNVTNDGTVTVGGLEAGATYEYSTDGGVTWTPGTGTSFELGEGTYAGVQVRQTDAAGNVSPAVSLGAVTIDTTIAAPGVALASDTGASASDGVTSDGTVNVTGLEPGATYEYSLDGGASWTPGTGGSFELAAGTYTGVQVRSTDVAGNVSAPASLGPVTVVTGPAGDLTLALENDTGASAADGVTSDGTVVVGGVDAGASYEYSTDGGVTWTPGTGTSFELAEGTYTDVQVRQVDGAGNTGAPTSLGAVTVDASAPGALVPALVSDTGTSGSDGVTGNGTVSVAGLESGATYEYSTDGGASWTPGSGTSFALGAGTYADVQVRQVDVAGNTGPASSLGAVTVDVAAAAPLAALASDSGASASDNVTNDGTVTVGGLEAGATYEYSTDGGVTWTPGTGTSFELGEGTYAGVQVRQTDAAGNVSPAVSLGAVTIDTTIAAPGVALASDTGASASDGVTSDGTVNVTGLEPGATYEYSLDGGASWTPGTGGSFELAAGTYTGVQVRSTDVAGNVSAPASLGPVTVVTGPAGDLTLALENDTGASAADGVTSDGTVVVGGVDAGASYEYSTDGGVTWTPGTGTSFELAEGTYTDVQVRQVDGAGNTGAPTSLGAVTVDVTILPLTAGLVSDSGLSGTDRITNDATIAIGSLEPGATYEYSLDGGATWTIGTGTEFEISDGTYANLQVRQTDQAGNLSQATTIAPFTVDTTVATLSAVLVNDTGTSALDGITSDGTIAIGDVEPGATWQYSTDGGATWQAGTGSSFQLAEGTYAGVQVRQTDIAGNVSAATSLGAVTVDNTVPGPLTADLVDDTGISASDQITRDGRVTVGGLEGGASFEYSLDGGATWQQGTGNGFTLPEGTYADVRVRQIDLAGNGGGTTTIGATRVDASAVAPAIALAVDTGISSSDGVTANGTVTVTGLESASQFQYSLDNGTTWTNGTGSSFALSEGTYGGVQVRQIDLAGNISPATQLGTVTVDTSVAAPSLALASDTGSSPTDLVTSDGTVRVDNLESGASWEYSIDGGSTWQAGIGMSFELNAGTYASVQVRQTDVAGNLSPATSLGPITVETSAGDLTAALENDTGASVTDGVTSDGTILVGAIAPGATFQYSLDGGASWQAGIGSSFELAPGAYADVQVRQVDGAGNIGAVTSLGALTVDQTAPGLLTLALTNDTGTSPSDNITNNGAVAVSGLEAGASFQYSLDGGGTWQAGTGTGFTLAAGTYADVQVRQVDLAGNLGSATSLGTVTIDTTVAALSVSLVSDTGVSSTDRITSDATVAIANLEAGATWQYSLNGGASWISGTGTSFEVADGIYANVQVRQVDRAGNVSGVVALVPFTIDTVAATPSVGLFADTGASPNDRVTNDATVTVGAIEPGATYQYSLNGGASWLTGSGASFELADGTYANVQVRQIDVAGNISGTALLAPVIVDTTVAPLSLALVTDTGTSANDRVTSDGTLIIGNLEPGAIWQYSTNDGATWINGTGTIFELAEGAYSGVQVRQIDRAGNVSSVTSIGAVTIDFPAAADDFATLNMGAQTSVTRPSDTDSSVTVVGLLESDVGADESVTVIVPSDRTGSVRIEVAQTALVAVADAFRLDVVDADGTVVYSAVTPNSLVGDVLGLEVLGLTGDNRIVAIVEGLPPGAYRVVVRNDESALAQLLDTNGGGVSLAELGSAGVVLGPQNQTLVLDAVAQGLGGGVLGATARGLLATTLGLTTDLNVGGLVGILTNLLSNPLINAPQLLNTVLGGVSQALLSNTLSLLQATSVTTQVTEYEYANETLTGNAILGNAGTGRDDLGGGAAISQVTNSDGDTVALPGGGSISIAGEYGVLTIAANGGYSYEAYGNSNAVGRSDVFTYTLSDGVVSDTATITIGLQGTVVSAGSDVGNSAVHWDYVTNNTFYNANGTIAGLVATQTYNSSNFVIGDNQVVSGFVSVASTATVAGSGTVLVQELVGSTWTTVRTVPYSVLVGVLGEVARIDLSTLNLDEGTYRVQATLRGLLSAVSVNTDVDVTYLDRFVHNGTTNASGNVLSNDTPGSLLTELEVYNRTTGTYLDVDAGRPVTVNGLYGSLTLNADGSYVYHPFDTLPYFNTARVDTFDYNLVHPSGELAHGTLNVTVQPTGAGVVSTLQPSMLVSESVPIENLLSTSDDHSAVTARSTGNAGVIAYDMLEGQGTIESILENYLKTSQVQEHQSTSPVSNADNDASDTNIAAVPESDPLGYLALHPDLVNTDHWQNHSMV